MLFLMKTGFAILALCAAPLAAAQSESAVPAAQSVGGVRYVQGGIGKDESSAMLEAAKGYPLSLVFSGGKGNHYIAAVDIHVRDAAGKTVLQARSDGPIILIDLPAGRYTIDAQYRDKTLTQRIELTPKRSVRVDLHWPSGE